MGEGGFVFSVEPDAESQSKARRAGRADGDRWVPAPGTLPGYLEEIRAAYLTSNAARAAATQRSFDVAALKVESDIDNPHAGQRIKYNMQHLRAYIKRFDDNKATALKAVQALEEIYLSEAEARWKAKGYKWSIPPLDSAADEIAGQRAEFDRLTSLVQ